MCINLGQGERSITGQSKTSEIFFLFVEEKFTGDNNNISSKLPDYYQGHAEKE